MSEFEKWYDKTYPLPPTIERGPIGRDTKEVARSAWEASRQLANAALEAEVGRLRKELETDKVIFELIAEDHCRPRKMRSNTHGKCVEAVERIAKALKKT